MLGDAHLAAIQHEALCETIRAMGKARLPSGYTGDSGVGPGKFSFFTPEHTVPHGPHAARAQKISLNSVSCQRNRVHHGPQQ